MQADLINASAVLHEVFSYGGKEYAGGYDALNRCLKVFN
jgi:hypothetical protein